MRIFHIIFTLNIGGAETMLVDIANEQSKEDDVTVCIIDDCLNVQLLNSISSRVKVILLGRKPGSHSLLPFLKLNCLLLKNKPDVVHIHNWQTPKVLLPWIHPVFTVHGMDRPSTYYKRLKGIIAISETVKNDVLAHGSFSVEVIPNGIVVDDIATKEPLSKKDGLNIVQVGRLKNDIKGQDLLINAIAKLRNQCVDNITLDIIGDGESKKDIEEQIIALGLSSRVRLLGSLSRSELYSCFKKYDLLCQPSRKEGFGLTVAEAMIAKLPVLVSDSGGPIEIIEHGKLGFSFVTGSVDSCAEAIKNVMECYGNNDMINMANDAYKKAVSSYSIKCMVEKYKEFYLRVK